VCIFRAITSVALVLFCSISQAAQPVSAETRIVLELYKAFGWEALIREPLNAGPVFQNQSRAVYRLYFDETLSNLLTSDRDCINRTHEICKIDFAILWGNQDPAAHTLKIFPMDRERIVRLTYFYPSKSELIELKFEIVQTKTGPRIHDIRYPGGGSLLQMLSEQK
jgi:hypothetical protein